MIEESMLRGSLVNTNEGKGSLGFKGERGYSNYEIYVKNGGTLTEQEWLDHFGVDLTGYAKTTEVDTKDNAIKASIGDLEDLETTDKTDVVSAINELNTNINSLDDRDSYTTTEKIIGTWIDNKPIYRKVINFGSLPNASLKSVAHNINNLDFVVNAWAIAKRLEDDNSVTFFLIPSARLALAEQMGLWASDTNVIITCGSDRTNITTCYVIIEYTKTTD